MLNDSASLASTQSRRSRASAVAVAGSVSSSSATSGPSDVRTCWNTASSKSIPPSCSTPSGGPRSRNPAPSRHQHRGVERAAAQVVHRDPVALGHPVARGVGDRRRLGLGARARRSRRPASSTAWPSRSRLNGPQFAGMRHADVLRRAALALGGDPDDPGQQPGRQRLRRERRPADDQGHRVADPPLELADHPRRLRRALLLGGLADDDLAVARTNTTEGTCIARMPRPEHLDPAVDVHRRGRVGRAEIDAEPITHPPPPVPFLDREAAVSCPDTSNVVRCLVGTGCAGRYRGLHAAAVPTSPGFVIRCASPPSAFMIHSLVLALEGDLVAVRRPRRVLVAVLLGELLVLVVAAESDGPDPLAGAGERDKVARSGTRRGRCHERRRRP